MLVDSVVEVVSVEENGYFVDENTSGSTVAVVLQRDNEFVKCEGILIWEDEMAEECFEDWKQTALEGEEEGYSYWTE